jgi:hypothetical protein
MAFTYLILIETLPQRFIVAPTSLCVRVCVLISYWSSDKVRHGPIIIQAGMSRYLIED